MISTASLPVQRGLQHGPYGTVLALGISLRDQMRQAKGVSNATVRAVAAAAPGIDKYGVEGGYLPG